MKRIICAALAAVMIMCCLTGCGSGRDPKYIGKWEAGRGGNQKHSETVAEFIGRNRVTKSRRADAEQSAEM